MFRGSQVIKQSIELRTVANTLLHTQQVLQDAAGEQRRQSPVTEKWILTANCSTGKPRTDSLRTRGTFSLLFSCDYDGGHCCLTVCSLEKLTFYHKATERHTANCIYTCSQFGDHVNTTLRDPMKESMSFLLGSDSATSALPCRLYTASSLMWRTPRCWDYWFMAITSGCLKSTNCTKEKLLCNSEACKLNTGLWPVLVLVLVLVVPEQNWRQSAALRKLGIDFF